MRQVAICLIFGLQTLQAADTGEKLFQTHCAPCHGPKGDGGRGSNLAVRTLPRAPDDAALATIISLGIPGTQMPGTRMTASELWELAAYVRGLGQSRIAQAPGDTRHGEALFWSKGNCGGCHTVGPRGGRTGPDLTDVGARRSPAWLRKALEEPEDEIPDTFAVYRRLIPMPDNFLQVRVVTLDGKRITGERVDEDTFTIQLRDYRDRFYSFRKDELREVVKDWGKSPMPAYRTLFSDSELQDVVAYLASLRGVR
jgi:cytochrome c oxidase cbb3-type subunit III